MSHKTVKCGERQRRKPAPAHSTMPIGMFGHLMRKCELCNCTFSPLRGDERRCRACSERSVQSLMIEQMSKY